MSVIQITVVLFLFGNILLPIVLKKLPVLLTPYQKADSSKRAIAFIIDFFISFSVVAIIFTSMLSGYYAFIMGALYILTKDRVFAGSSIGKIIVGLKVIGVKNGKPCTLKQSMIRNSILVIPGLNLAGMIYETLCTINDPKGIRIGDRLAGTQVVVGKELPELSKLFQLLSSYDDPIWEKIKGKQTVTYE